MTRAAWYLVTGPSAEPIAAATAKEHLRVDHSADDALITALITAARQHVEEITGRALINQTWELQLDAWQEEVRLPRPPLASITSVKYTSDAAVTATLAVSAYTIQTAAEPGRLLFDLDALPDTTLADMAGIQIRYAAGYGATGASVPQAILQALLLLIGQWYQNRMPIVVGAPFAELPFAVRALLAPYRLLGQEYP